MGRIYDCFPFFNELDLLEIRLNELAPVVDRFVIAEAPVTYSGEPKPLHFRDNRQRFAAFDDRIVAIVVDAMPAGEDGWARQDRQRDALAEGLGEAGPDDLILLSDVDEIPRASVLAEAAAQVAGGEVACFGLRMFKYFLNCELREPWLRHGPRAVRRGLLPRLSALRRVRGATDRPLQALSRGIDAALRLGRPVRRRFYADAGWHFSYLGTAETLPVKMRSFVGSEKVAPELLGREAWAARLAAEIGLAEGGKEVTLRPLDESFPRYLRDHRDRFADLIADEARLAGLADGRVPA